MPEATATRPTPRPEPPVTCGNGKLDPGELCEGEDFGGKTCASIGLGTGQLLCNA